MDIKEALYSAHSKEVTAAVVQWVGNNAERFSELLALATSNDLICVQRGSWVLTACCDKYPGLAVAHQQFLFKLMAQENLHSALLRSILRIFQTQEVPEHLQGELYSKVWDIFCHTDTEIAQRVFAMQILANIALPFPDLSKELAAQIKAGMAHATPAYTSRGKKILKKLEKAVGN